MMIAVNASAQSKLKASKFVSGDYSIFKVACDSISKSFTMVTDITEGNISCTLFISGKMIKDSQGKYPLKAYLWDKNASQDGKLTFKNGIMEIQLKESGSCQNIYDFEHGAGFTLDRIYPYRKFSMIVSKKAIAYSNYSTIAHKKGYLLKGDFVSIISENKDFRYIEYKNKPSFKAWVKKSDLIL